MCELSIIWEPLSKIERSLQHGNERREEKSRIRYCLIVKLLETIQDGSKYSSSLASLLVEKAFSNHKICKTNQVRTTQAIISRAESLMLDTNKCLWEKLWAVVSFASRIYRRQSCCKMCVGLVRTGALHLGTVRAELRVLPDFEPIDQRNYIEGECYGHACLFLTNRRRGTGGEWTLADDVVCHGSCMWARNLADSGPVHVMQFIFQASDNHSSWHSTILSNGSRYLFKLLECLLGPWRVRNPS